MLFGGHRARFFQTEIFGIESLAESLWPQTTRSKGNILLLILQSFDWLAAFHPELLQAILFIAPELSAPVFLATCFKYCIRGFPKAFFTDIAPSRMFTTR